MKPLLIALLVLPFVADATPATAPAPNPGVLFEIETVVAGAAPMRVDAAVEGTNARMRMPGQNSDAIYRGDRREMIIVNPGAKSYMVMDDATVKQLGAQMNQAMAQMEQMMANMPPEQRARMEEMMKGRGMAVGGPAAAPSEIRRTNERATHSGFPTTKYEVLQGGRKTQELWVTPWSNVDGFQEAQPVFESMAEFFNGMLSSFGRMGGPAASDSSAFTHMKELGGFPVVTQAFDESGNPTVRSTLLAVRRQTVPASDFDPPAGYQRQALPGGR